MKQRNLIVFSFLAIVTVAILSFFIGRNYKTCEQVVNITKIDTITVVDTFIKEVPKPHNVYLTGDTTYITKLIKDTDTIYVPIPLMRKEYKTDDYFAIVQGYEPSLYYIETYNKTKYIDKYVPYKVNPKWGIGLQLGATYLFDSKKVSPYVGIGVQYNLITW